MRISFRIIAYSKRASLHFHLELNRTKAEILSEYPYLESEDIDQALIYAAWRLEEHEEPILLS